MFRARNMILILVACVIVVGFLILGTLCLRARATMTSPIAAQFSASIFLGRYLEPAISGCRSMGLLEFRDRASRILFFGVFCTSLGSAYYHLAPDNARLFWDRLPMTIAFMSLFAIAINRRKLAVPFVLLGVGSVVWWRMTDNLWPYGLVQFGTMAALLVIAARREPGLWPVFIFYGMSKISEHFDQQIYSISSTQRAHDKAPLGRDRYFEYLQLDTGLSHLRFTHLIPGRSLDCNTQEWDPCYPVALQYRRESQFTT